MLLTRDVPVAGVVKKVTCPIVVVTGILEEVLGGDTGAITLPNDPCRGARLVGGSRTEGKELLV